MSKQRNSLCVPVSFFHLAVIEKDIRTLQVFLTIKLESNIRLKLDLKQKQRIAKSTKVSISTLNRILKKLERKNWIQRDLATPKYYFIRGFDRIRYMQQHSWSRAIKCYRSDITSSLNGFKAFSLTACYAIIILKKQSKIWERHYSSRQKKVGQTQEEPCPIFSKDDLWEISNTYIGKFVKRDVSFIKKYKKIGRKLGCLYSKSRLKRIYRDGSNQPVSSKELPNFIKFYEENENDRRLIGHKGLVYVRMTSLVRVNLILTKRRSRFDGAN